MGILSILMLFLQLPLFQTHPYHEGVFDRWYEEAIVPRPVDLVTDIINDLGIRILQEYVDPGNVAFSPTGIGFVVAALYEGSAGRGCQQIVDVLGLPLERDITRIGFRDIHRRLRTYLNADGFLGGLTLNRDNIHFRSEYEDLLRFYGFDLSGTANNDTVSPTTKGTAINTMTPTFGPKSETSTPAMPPPPPITGRVPETTMNIDSMQDKLTEITTVGVMVPTDESQVTDSPSYSTSLNSMIDLEQSTTISPASSPSSSSFSETLTTTALIDVGVPETEPTITSTMNILMVNEVDTTMTTDASTLSTDSINNEPIETTMGDQSSILTEPTSSEMISNTNDTGFTTIDDTTTTDPMTSIPFKDDTTNRVRKRRAKYSRDNFFTFSEEGIWMQDLGTWDVHSYNRGEIPLRDTTELSFLVNGCDLSSVSATRYTAVLPFAYSSTLHAVGLEFPLDDPRYSILLLMPTDRTDTQRLARDLSEKSLRSLRKQLQPTWIRATIPSFMLRGFVTLTRYLQRLGIRDVFEPRLANLSPMTPDLGIYVRDVQQSIGVNIRNYMKSDRMNSRESSFHEPLLIVPARRDHAYRLFHSGNGIYDRTGPIPFTAQYPFLYFIIDVETSVTLIAGRVDDPLNSRILG